MGQHDPHPSRPPMPGAAQRLAVTAAVAALLLAGCGITDPDYVDTTSPSATSTTLTVASADHDGPTLPPRSRLAAGAVQASPAVALAWYGRLYVNWSWQTVAGDQRRLAGISVGQARAQALAAAAQPEAMLARYAVHNQGQVVAIAPGQGIERGKWAVVTDEQTSGDGPYEGLPATSHVTWATVQRTAQGWVLSGWYPGS